MRVRDETWAQGLLVIIIIVVRSLSLSLLRVRVRTRGGKASETNRPQSEQQSFIQLGRRVLAASVSWYPIVLTLTSSLYACYLFITTYVRTFRPFL